MRTLMVAGLLLAASTQALADKPVYFTDGSMAWQGENGQTWGKTPSPQDNNNSNDNGGHNNRPLIDTDGTVYAPAGSGHVNTRTGQFMPGR